MSHKTEMCPVCSELFTKKSNMYAHMRNVHNMTGERDPVSRNLRKKTELCAKCGRGFTTKHNLQRHAMKMHDGVSYASHARIKCSVPGCQQIFKTYVFLRDHLVECHDKKLLVDEIQFISEEDFHLWKEDMQAKTVSLYVADTSKKTMKDGTQKQYYNCHRSYTYRETGQNKRRLKSAGSIKIGTTCPARLEVTIRNGFLHVKFWKTHVGHNMDQEHIHLSKAARTEIADKMKQGLSFHQILNDIHTGKLQTIDPQRALLVKRKDLHNIYRDFHIGSMPKQLKINVNTSDILQEEIQLIENDKQDHFKLQEIFSAIQNEELQITEPLENIGKQNDIHGHLFHNCEGIPPPSNLEENGPVSSIDEIHQLATSEPILYFEEQHSDASTVIQISGGKQEFSVYFEEIEKEDGTVSDQEGIVEDQNGFPIIYHEDVAREENQLMNKAMCSNMKNTSPKFYHENIVQDNNQLADKTLYSSLKNDSAKLFDAGCPDCGQVFTKRKNLYAHMRNIHKLTGDKDPFTPPKRPKTEICSLCGKSFTNKNTVRRHRQKIHKEGIFNSHTPRIRCPDGECQEMFSSYIQLREHLFVSHQVELVMEDLHFVSEKEFQIWKDSIQATTVSFYVMDTSRKVMKDGTQKKYYNCHRSHSYRSTGKNIRKLKSSGSSKIGRTCPSRLEVIVRNGELDVRFWKTHLGHSMDVEHTTLSKAVRAEIAEMLKQGSSFEHVLELARNGKLLNQSQRSPLIKRKDLHNICRDFHISLAPLQSTDEVVDNWCSQGFHDR